MLDRLKISARVFYDEATLHRVTLGRAVYLTRTKLGDGLRTAYYRDVVRPWILATPPFEGTDDSRCEIHVLTSIGDWLNLLWTLKSFYHWSGCRFALCIHDDGTLTPTAFGHLQTAFPKARIIRRLESDKRLGPMLANYPRSREFRETNKLSLKVFDFQAYLEAERLMLLDSDLLFFDTPAVLLALLADPATTFNTLNKDWRHGYSFETEQVQPLLDFDFPPLINAGLGLIHRGSVRFDWVEEFLVLPGIMGHSHQIEQTLTALCSARFGYKMLPEEYDVYMGPRRPGTPSRHYTGPIRRMMYDEGIRELVRNGFLEAFGAAAIPSPEMKIGIVSPEFPPEKGGIQTYGFEFTQELARRGHDVTVFTCPHAGGELEPEKFRIEPMLRLRRRLDRRILQTGAFDVWHAMNAAYAWLALEAPRVFVTVHGNDFLCPYQSVARLDLRERLRLPFGSNLDRWLGERLTGALVNRALPRAEHIFTNSQYTRELFLRRHPECRDRTTAAMVGVSDKYLSQPRPARAPGPTRLLTVCRLAEPHKNVDIVLQALARLRADFDFHYTIVGDGYLRSSLEKLTDESGLRDRVTFTGFVEAAELHPLLLTSDLFILTTSATPTAYEGFGLVYIEAAACGLPALAARIGGAVEAVREGNTGMFVEEVTTEAIELRLRHFLSGGVRFAPMDCMSFARTFSWANVVDRCLDFYQSH